MPSTYTLNNGIELIATGEQSGTWGDTTNTNLELLDAALDGQVTVTLTTAGTSGSPNTLAISDGSASDGRNRMVIFNDGGDLGATAYVQLTPNDAEKIIYVRNDLAGSRSIILFQGTYNASNDYELPAGTTAVIYFDGAGSGAVAANVFNNAYFDSLRLGSVSVTEIIDDDTMASAAATNIATSESIKAYVDAQVGANNELSEVLANGNTTGGTDISVSSGDDITFADSSKAIFGAGSDLSIYHNATGSHSFITESGGGSLYIQGTELNLTNAAGTSTYANFVDGGAAFIRYAGSTKIATTSSGIDVTGRIEGDTLNIGDQSATHLIQAYDNSGSTPISFGLGEQVDTARGMRIEKVDEADDDPYATNFYFADHPTSSTGSLNFFASQAKNKTLRINSNGDITFYDASGNASFVYDESAGSTFNENGDAKDFTVKSDNNGNMLFVNAGDDEVVIGSNTGLSSAHLTVTSTESDPYVTGTINTGGGLALYKNNNDEAALESVGLRFRVTNNNGSSNADGAITYVMKAAGDHDGFMAFQTRRTDGTRQEQLRLDSASGPVLNQDQLSGFDFKVKTSGNANMLFVDGANDRVGIGTATTNVELTVDGSISNLGTYDGAYYYSPYELPTTSVASNSPRYIILCRINSSGRFINGTIYGARSTASSATRTARYDVAVAVNSSGTIQHANVTQYGYPPSSVVEVQTFTYDSITYVGLYIGSSGSSAYPTGYYFNGIASSIGEVVVVDDSLVSGASEYTGTVGYTGLRNQSLIVYDKSTTLNESGDSGGDFRVESSGNANMLFVDAGDNAVGIGTNAPLNFFNQTAAYQWFDTTSTFLTIDGGNKEANINLQAVGDEDDHQLGGIWWANKNGQSDAHRQVAGISARMVNGNSIAGADLEIWTKLANAGNTVPIATFGFDGHFTNQKGATFNDSADGDNKGDFRVESDSNTHMLFVDAGNDRVGINEDTPTGAKLHVDAGASGDDAARFETGAAGGIVYARGNNVGNGSSHYTIVYENADTEIAQITTRNRSGSTASSGDIAYELQHTLTNASSYFGWYIGGSEYLSLSSSGTEFNTSNGTNKLYVTRSGATNQSGAMYADDSTFVFDSIQDETGGAGFLFRGTNASASEFSYLVLDYSTGATFNNDARNTFDFRVESESNTHAIYLDAGAYSGAGAIGFGVSSPQQHVHQANDTGRRLGKMAEWSGFIGEIANGETRTITLSNLGNFAPAMVEIWVAWRESGGSEPATSRILYTFYEANNVLHDITVLEFSGKNIVQSDWSTTTGSNQITFNIENTSWAGRTNNWTAGTYYVKAFNSPDVASVTVG